MFVGHYCTAEEERPVFFEGQIRMEDYDRPVRIFGYGLIINFFRRFTTELTRFIIIMFSVFTKKNECG
jgi:hypothetical protein